MVACQQPPKPAKVARVHRSTAAPLCPQRPAGGARPDVNPPSPDECAKDEDCKSGRNGRCMHRVQQVQANIVGSENRCEYDACGSDGDCGAGMACLCAGELGAKTSVNICIPADCKTDADCHGYSCSPTFVALDKGECRSESQPYQGLRCHTPDDRCVDDEDCNGGECVYSDAKRHWVCSIRFVCYPD